jgi:hypothetical protein
MVDFYGCELAALLHAVSRGAACDLAAANELGPDRGCGTSRLVYVDLTGYEWS